MNRYRLLSLLLLCAACGASRAAGHPFSDGRFPGQDKIPVREIHWEDWRADTIGCQGKRWTYLDSLDRSALIGTPKDTILKYLGAPGRIERYESSSRFLLVFHKKEYIPYHLYPITSDCTSREPAVAVKIYYDRQSRVMGFSRKYHP